MVLKSRDSPNPEGLAYNLYDLSPPLIFDMALNLDIPRTYLLHV